MIWKIDTFVWFPGIKKKTAIIMLIIEGSHLSHKKQHPTNDFFA